jgi:hypothetical protein
LPAKLSGLPVLIEGHGTATEYIPGKLIEQDDLREYPAGLTSPVVETLLGGEKHHRQETPTDFLVEPSIRSEPLVPMVTVRQSMFVQLAKPEIQNLFPIEHSASPCYFK